MLANVFVDIGKSLNFATKVDLDHVMPSPTLICTTLQWLAEHRRTYFCIELFSIIPISGCITYEGLNLKDKGGKFYDGVLHYFLSLEYLQSATFHSRVLYGRIFDSESSSAVRATMTDGLTKVLGKSLKNIMPHFSFVNDCTLAMPAVFGV